MSEIEAVETTTDDEEVTTDSTESEELDETEDEQPDPTEGLKKALKAERLARREAERKARDLEAEKESAGKEPEEKALDQARREAAAEATAKANARILKSEIRAAAKGRLADPSDAFAYLDAGEFEVGEDGEVDLEAIEEAINDLLKRKPYLAAESVKKFEGGADQGARGKQTKSAQMSQAEFDRIKTDFRAVKKAKDEGRLNALLGITN